MSAVNDTIQLKLALLGLSSVEAGLNHLKGSLNGVQVAAKTISTVGGLTTVLGVGSIGAAALALANFTKHAIESADALGKLGQKAGLPVTELSGLAYSAKLSDVGVDEL